MVTLRHYLDLVSNIVQICIFGVYFFDIEDLDGHIFHVVDRRLVEAVGPPDDAISTHADRSIKSVGLLIEWPLIGNILLFVMIHFEPSLVTAMKLFIKLLSLISHCFLFIKK